MTTSPQPLTDQDDIALFLAPLSEAAPCGAYYRYEPDFDALKAAREEDDETLPSGVWTHDLKRADWPFVRDNAARLLKEESKDLLVAAWLGEAWIVLEGLQGLERALRLVGALCVTFPDCVHPVPEDGDASARGSSLDWLGRRYAFLLVNRTPLALGVSPPVVLGRLMEVRKLIGAADRKKVPDLQREAQAFRDHVWDRPYHEVRCQVELCRQALGALTALERWIDETIPGDPPSLAALRQALDQALLELSDLMETHPMAGTEALPPDVPASGTPETDESKADESTTGGSFGKPLASSVGMPLNGRDDAYRALRQIADYLSRIEPHSPTPYLVRKAVEWGAKPLPELLNELIEADDNARRLWRQLGIL